MRLSDYEHECITRAIATKDRDAAVFLFGSRANDAARGGDIDLLVLSGKIGLMDKLDILAELHGQLGEQKIDLVVFPDLSRPFARLAASQGVRL